MPRDEALDECQRLGPESPSAKRASAEMTRQKRIRQALPKNRPHSWDKGVITGGGDLTARTRLTGTGRSFETIPTPPRSARTTIFRRGTPRR